MNKLKILRRIDESSFNLIDIITYMDKNLNFDYLNNSLNQFELSENDSYVNTYQNFIEHFKAIQEIEWHDVVIGSHLVYGWMPTIINLNYSEKDKVVKVLNLAKKGYELSINDLFIVKKTVNNSLVGASKLLHFINPKKYAIWDSRIFRFITEKKSQYGIDKPENYLEYLRGLTEISNNMNYQSFHKKVESKFDYKITAFRAIEIVMFETDRSNHKK